MKRTKKTNRWCQSSKIAFFWLRILWNYNSFDQTGWTHCKWYESQCCESLWIHTYPFGSTCWKCQRLGSEKVVGFQHEKQPLLGLKDVGSDRNLCKDAVSPQEQNLGRYSNSFEMESRCQSSYFRWRRNHASSDCCFKLLGLQISELWMLQKVLVRSVEKLWMLV